MGEPDDIPLDVWAVVDAMPLYGDGYPDDQDRRVIARAILAERERCAAVCLAEAKAFLSPEYASNQPLGSLCERFACEQCAAAIRKGGEA